MESPVSHDHELWVLVSAWYVKHVATSLASKSFLTRSARFSGTLMAALAYLRSMLRKKFFSHAGSLIIFLTYFSSRTLSWHSALCRHDVQTSIFPSSIVRLYARSLMGRRCLHKTQRNSRRSRMLISTDRKLYSMRQIRARGS